MPQPMTVGLLGPADAPIPTAISLLEDLTEKNDPIHFVIAADAKNWTDTTGGIVDFLVENEVSFDLVLDDTSDIPEDITSAAASTVKVARPAQKVIALLERADGDKRLTILWDDEDESLPKVMERAIDKGIMVLDLAAGLEELGFPDESEPLPDDEAAAAESEPLGGEGPDDDTSDETPEPDEDEDDGLDDLGVRALRNKVEADLGLTRKVVGGMDKAACIAALRGAKGAVTPEPEDEVEEQEDDSAQEIAEDDAVVAQMAEDESFTEVEQITAEPVPANTQAPAVPVSDIGVRDRALELSIAFHSSDTEVDVVIRTAHRFRSFLLNEQTVPGRPRKDGSPAQPRS